MSDNKTKATSKNFGFTKDGKVYRKAFNDFKDLEIGEVRESDEKSIEYFIDRYDALVEKVNELEQAIEEASNKGSFLMKLLHIKEKIATYKGIGDFKALLIRLHKVEEDLQGNIADNRVKNLEIKDSLLKEALGLKDSKEWDDTAEKMKELRLNWLRTGAVIDEKQNEIEELFHNTVNHFFEEKRKFNEARKKEINDKSKRYKYLISQVKKLSYESDKEVIYKRINEIKADWEKVGALPFKVMRLLESKLARSIQDLKQNKRRRRIGQPNENRGYSQGRPYGNDSGSYQQRNRVGGDSRRSQDDRRNYQMSDTADKEMIENKNRLLNLALELKDLSLDESIPLAKDLQEQWLKTGKSTAPEIRTIYNRFRETIALLFESNGLKRQIDKNHPAFSSKSSADQKIVKIATMRELIKREKSEIRLFEDNLNENGIFDKSDVQSKMLISRLKNQKYKLKIKETLLHNIELG
jgi:hypothetical protein